MRNALSRYDEAQEPKKGEVLVFITHQARLGSGIMTQIYQRPWQIETFFKTRIGACMAKMETRFIQQNID